MLVFNNSKYPDIYCALCYYLQTERGEMIVPKKQSFISHESIQEQENL